MKRTIILIVCLLTWLPSFGQTTEGPKNGHLIIAGGALKRP